MGGKAKRPTYAELLAIVEAMRAENAALKREVAQLRDDLAKAKKNSGNSSKPPSSDIVKPKDQGASQGKKGKKRKIGGQPGHKKHERSFELSQADEQHGYILDHCPHGCDGKLIPLPGEEKILYQYELVAKPVLLHAHIAGAYWCPECDEIHRTEVPSAIRAGGLVGERLTSLIGYLKGGCHASYSVIQTLLQDAWGVRLIAAA